MIAKGHIPEGLTKVQDGLDTFPGECGGGGAVPVGGERVVVVWGVAVLLDIAGNWRNRWLGVPRNRWHGHHGAYLLFK